MAVRGLDRTSGPPLWAQLRADLQRRVEAGEFGAAFPPESSLVAEYGVSRYTVREALRRFREDGVLISARGRNPRLAGTEIEQPLGVIYSLFAAVESAGLEQRSVVRALDVRTDAAVARRIALPPEAELLYLERVRLADDEPLALDRVWLPAEPTRPLLGADFSHTALYAVLDERCGIRLTGGREQIRAVLPDPAQRRLLAMPAQTAALAVDRSGERAGSPFEWRHSLIRGDRFTLRADFSAQGYRLDLTPERQAAAR